MSKKYLSATLIFSVFLLSGCSLPDTGKKIDFENIQSAGLKEIGFEYSSFMTDGKRILCYSPPLDNETATPADFVMVDGKHYGRVIKNVDVSKFQAITNYYGKDDKHVYYSCRVIEGSDPLTYKLLSAGSDYGVDQNNVYWLNKKIAGADPKTFRSLNRSYGKDKQSAYYLNNKINMSDAASFMVLSDDYAKDKNFVYYLQNQKETADPKTFVNLGKKYFKDKYRVYFDNETVEGMDPTTASFIGYMYYAKDKDSIFYNASKIEGSDAKSFRLFGSYVRDNTGIYIDGQRFNNFDEKTLKYLGFLYYKDKNNVYREGNIISSNPGSFTLLGNKVEDGSNYYSDVYVKDQGSIFYGSKRLENLDANNTKYFLDKNQNPSVTDGHCIYTMSTLDKCE